MKGLFIAIILFFQISCVEAQIFPAGSRVCFVGNSITNNGEFHHNILLYHLTRYPKENVSFFNCGISGDVTGGILTRMEDDILVHKPTHIVLMIGMNDVKRSLYGEQVSSNADTLALREKAIGVYKTNLEKIINIFLAKKIKLILQRPTIYDQTALLPTSNNLGVNDALKICADFVSDLAKINHLQVVDYWTIMNTINHEIQKKDPASTLTSNDRVHPQSTGHLIMAYQFLKDLKADSYISEVSLTSKGKAAYLYNCDLINVNSSKNRYSFSIKEKALPFPIISQQESALQLVPFQKEFNQQYFRITDLPNGKYTLSIDTIFIGLFSAEDLEHGINLATYRNTPQYQQSMKLRNILTDLWIQESNLRNIKFIEYNSDYIKCIDKSSLEAVKNCLMPVFKLKSTEYYSNQLIKYLLNKPFEKKITEISIMLRKQAYKISQPKKHIYTLEKK
jgi:endoglucanase